MRLALATLLVVLAAAGCAGGGEDAAPPATTAAATEPAQTEEEERPVLSALQGAEAFPICAAGGDFWPTEVLAVAGPRLWVACKEDSLLVELDLETGAEGRTVELAGTPIAVTAGFGSIWAVESFGTLTRLAETTADVEAEIDLGTSRPYNVWIGADSVWVADDGGGEMIRIDPVENEVVARIPVGDGPADIAFSGTSAWVIDHRDRRLVRIDTERNRATVLRRIPGGAPERLELVDGTLWVTGRGTDLLRVDPETGRVEQTVDVGASGIDLVAADGAVWVPSRSDAVDPSGFPTMEALRRVAPNGKAATAAQPTALVDVHGLVASDGYVWLADTTNGVLYRFPTG